ncbi:MAG: ATP-dependent RecD-like DNA helicase [Pelotomaculum sp. PtaB.Bin104]|nr:MAG: ATP-dependent RecD-like DNA helicase [Pelotomaculum sp. PtaB.Bin104]
MDQLRCVVVRITFKNEDNGFCVIKVRAKGFSDLVTVVGNMVSVNVGSVLTLKGNWKQDGKYGRQFAAAEWEETLPATAYGIEKYLGSGMVKGIGPGYAKKIVQQFGADTLNVIETEPDRLIDVPGIGQKRVNLIKAAWQEQKEIKNVMLFLQDHGVNTSHAVKIYKAYGNGSIDIVKTNPYKLADDIWGIGFKTADIIAAKLGFSQESYVRCRSGILYTLNELSNEGHCYATRDQLIQTAIELLDIEEGTLSITLDHMLKEQDVMLEKPDALYIPPLFFSEVGTARRILEILHTPGKQQINDVDQIISEVQDKTGIIYDQIQVDAIHCAVQSKIMVLTGGPGTGKTTTTLAIIAAFAEFGMQILLAAPTGRAAKRLAETSGMEAKTIHRLLEYKPPGGYQKNSDNPLEGDVLIIDEASMIDIVLMYNLFKAIPDNMIIIIVGDVDQLPSVGPGNVLRDIINSGVVPVIKLERIFRQALGSAIVRNAHRINEGLFPDIKADKNSNFFFIEANDPAGIPDIIRQLCSTRLPSYYKADPVRDIQVLCPMQRGETGAMNMNIQLQASLNKHSLSLRRGGTEYRLHDKVMQVRNNYDKNVFNGDIGIVSDVSIEDDSLTIDFDGVQVLYDISDLDEVVLSYATTIHKAQGSEYPIVIIPLTMQHFIMLQKNLLYTGVTRAKKIVIIIGSKKAIECAVKNNKVTERNTGLKDRLRN